MAIDSPNFQRDGAKFTCLGINLSLPVDLLPPGKYRALENVRPYGEGQIIGRPAVVLASTTVVQSIHSMKVLNDPIPSPVQFPGAFHPKVAWIGNGTQMTIGIPPTPNALFDLINVEVGFSGNPFGMVAARPFLSDRPWVYIADSLKMRAQSSTTNSRSWGVPPPNDPPTAIAQGAQGSAPNGPDIGVTGTPYVYCYRGRKAADIYTGAYGNAGPAMRNVDINGNPIGVSARQQNILVTIVTPMPLSGGEIAILDIFRFGGSLQQWTYIGSISNFAGSFMADTFNDAAIAANPQLEFDNFQPFPTLDQPRTGFCTVAANTGGQAGGIVTITSGSQFLPYNPANLDQPYYGFGNQIIIGRQTFTFYRSPTSATQVEVVETPLTLGTNQQFTMPSPQIWHQQLQFIWGPFGGGFSGVFIFGCGLLNDLGAIVWTKGNVPDSAPDVNRLLITSPSEPMQNGCMYGGNSWAFSSERMFAMYPTFGQATDFIAIEVPNSKGLFMRWALCVGRKGIYFRARDGIYVTSGGPPQSITDADLYSIFPHETATSSFVADGQTATPSGFGGAFSPPNDQQEAQQRLSYADGFVYFTYLAQDGHRYTLIYNEETGGWISRDHYTPEINTIYAEEGGDDLGTGLPEHQTFLLGVDGFLHQYSTALSDNGAAIAGRIRTGSRDQGDPRPRKLYGDLYLDFDGSCDAMDITVGFDGFSYFSALALSGLNLTGRRGVIGDINTGLGQHAANIGLEIDWSTTDARPAFYFWEPSYLPRPEITILRATDWTDDGRAGSKFFQGMLIQGDSLNAPRTLNVQLDAGGVAVAGLNFQASNRQELVYSFAIPFISKLVRLVPTDLNQWRLFGIRWIWEPAPDLAQNWITQATTHDFPSFFHHRDGYFALIAPSPVTFTVRRMDNGDTFPYTIPATTGGALYQQKQYLVLQPMKAKEVQYGLTSPAGFRLFIKDTSIRVGGWGRSDAYRAVQPFGDVHREAGAVI